MSYNIINPWPSWIEIYEGVCTLRWLYMDVTMAIFHVFPRYKKINKIKYIEIIEKGTHLSKYIIINFSKMKKSNQNYG
jgi:hypothetical protein